MLAITDYGVGNLFSLCSSFGAIGENAVITDDPEVIERADRIVLPGVGAFGDAMKKLKNSGLDKVITEQAKSGKPLLGICLGMQMLFEKSYEYGEFDGLGLLSGKVVPMEGTLPKKLKIPHIGWNMLNIRKNSPLFKYIKDGEYVYFVHSFYATECGDSLIADTDYGVSVTAAVGRNNIFGCQFHPEKSGKIGLDILRAFCETEVAK